SSPDRLFLLVCICMIRLTSNHTGSKHKQNHRPSDSLSRPQALSPWCNSGHRQQGRCWLPAGQGRCDCSSSLPWRGLELGVLGFSLRHPSGW
uniref:Uncharacterized protein n=1 Tax=Catharus ustulatus TaxID=91951 RepID=A0A8C3XYS6_CATUS